MENKEKIIQQKQVEVDILDKEINLLLEKQQSLQQEIADLKAPAIPTDMIGKFISSDEYDQTIFMRIDSIDTVGHLSGCESYIRFFGFGITKKSNGAINISNNDCIIQYPYAEEDSWEDQHNKGIHALLPEEFNDIVKDALMNVSKSIY